MGDDTEQLAASFGSEKMWPKILFVLLNYVYWIANFILLWSQLSSIAHFNDAVENAVAAARAPGVALGVEAAGKMLAAKPPTVFLSNVVRITYVRLLATVVLVVSS